MAISAMTIARISLVIILSAQAALAFMSSPISTLHARRSSTHLQGGRLGGRAPISAAGLSTSSLPAMRHKSSLTLRCSADGGAFTKWLEDNGARLACNIAAGTNGRGLVAKDKLKAGDEVCSIPMKVMMTEESAEASLGSKASDLDAETAIALQLIKEKANGGNSFYAPWIAMLPTRETLDVPLFWSQEERDLLKGSKVEEDTLELKDALKEEFEQLMEQGWGQQVPSLTLEEYEWATSIVSSRSHEVPKLKGGVALAPLVDFPEHSTTQGGKVELIYEGMFREPRLKFASGGPTDKGGRVCVDYRQSNNQLVFKRGLADLKVIRGAYELSFSVSPMDRFRDDKEDILEQVGYSPEQTFLLDSEEDDISASTFDMLAFLRLVCLSKTDVFLLESVFRNDVWGFMQLPVSMENEKMMLETLVGYCEGSLEGYETSDVQDAALQNDPNQPLRARLAGAAKLSERKALRKALNLYVNDMDFLDEKEYYQERRLKELNLDRPLDESEIVDPDIPISRDFNTNF